MVDDAFTHLFFGNFWDVRGIDLVITNSVETPNLFPALRLVSLFIEFPFVRCCFSGRDNADRFIIIFQPQSVDHHHESDRSGDGANRHESLFAINILGFHCDSVIYPGS